MSTPTPTPTEAMAAHLDGMHTIVNNLETWCGHLSSDVKRVVETLREHANAAIDLLKVVTATHNSALDATTQNLAAANAQLVVARQRIDQLTTERTPVAPQHD